MSKRITWSIAFAVACFVGPTQAAQLQAHDGGPDARHPRGTVIAMERSKFWAIIQATTSAEGNPDAQIVVLDRELQKLSAGDVASFEVTFDELMRESYSWDLWGADYVIHGGASDDSFEYFRVWLISKGRQVFEAVSRDPDSLANLVAQDSRGPLEFEEFAYVARNAWAAKTGRKIDDMPVVANMMYGGLKPSGNAFEENEPYLSKRYPKLWKRFGHNPAS